jgi:hypothetical protein
MKAETNRSNSGRRAGIGPHPCRSGPGEESQKARPGCRLESATAIRARRFVLLPLSRKLSPPAAARMVGPTTCRPGSAASSINPPGRGVRAHWRTFIHAGRIVLSEHDACPLFPVSLKWPVMKNRVMFFVFAGAILAIAGAMCIPQAHAPSHTTVEDDSLRVVSVATEIFVAMHGRPPRSWEDLGPRIRLEAVDRDMVSAHGFRFRDRYQFVTQPLPMFRGDDKGSQVILVRVIPFKDYRQRGEAFRSFVYMDSDRRVSPSRISQERAQELFKTYGITIPVPPAAERSQFPEWLRSDKRPQAEVSRFVHRAPCPGCQVSLAAFAAKQQPRPRRRSTATHHCPRRRRSGPGGTQATPR